MESVSNLTVTPFNSTTVLISWSPPFTLEGVPILGYNVTITNTTSGENETMLVEDTTLLYSIDHPDSENNFTVTVVPINEVGTGQPKVHVKFALSHKDELVDSKSSVRFSTIRATLPLEEKTNIFNGIVPLIIETTIIFNIILYMLYLFKISQHCQQEFHHPQMNPSCKFQTQLQVVNEH